MQADRATDRTVLKITGSDRMDFLQGLITNDIKALGDGLLYAALLSPQGKYLFDFLLRADNDAILLDVKSDAAPALAGRLNMYKLRADVAIEATDLPVWLGTGKPPKGALGDPRHPALGWRYYGDLAATPAEIDRDAIRVEHVIPETGIELIHNESYILEMGFERLKGVSFRKGCYVGQEVTARMKHKTELRKGLARVEINGAAAPGTPITRDGRPVGTLHTVSGNRAIAYLRFDQAGSDMQAGDATLVWDGTRPDG